jgi:hypothetical protein
MTNKKALLLAFSASLALAMSAASMAAKKPAAPAPPPPPPPPRTKVCLVLPKAQLGQGTSGADVAEPVRATLTAYLGGPATELISLTSRIPIQIDAEAQTYGCEYVLYSSVTQKKGGGLSKIFSTAAPLATMAGGMAGMGGNYQTMMGAQVVAQAASSAASQSAQQEAMEALEYKLMKPGVAEPVVTQSMIAKAKETGEDLVSPLIEQAATQVLTTITKPATP